MNKEKYFWKFNRFNDPAVKDGERNIKHDKRGFTLAELLITVAILAIVVAVSIPMLNSHLDEAKESVCLTNRTSFEQALTIQQMMHKNNPSWAVTGLPSYFEAHKEEYKCPSDGSYSLEMTTAGELVVKCSVHGASTSE